MKTNTAASTLLRSCTRFAPLALTVALAAVLAACGGGGSTTTSATPTATTPATTPTTTPGTTTAVVTPVATPTPVVVAPVVGNLATSVPTPTYAAGSKELAMFTQLNDVRLKGGFGMLAQDAAVDKAAANHAAYLVKNFYTVGTGWDSVKLTAVDSATGNLAGHVETAGISGFTGVRSLDRIQAAGGQQFVVSGEVAAFLYQSECLDSLLNTVFHRSSLLNTNSKFIGFGVGFTPDNLSFSCVINTAYTTAQIRPAGWTGVHPGVGQTGVPLGMGGEAPDPAPEVPNAQKGSPVSIYLNGPLTTVNAFTLTAAGSSTPVPVKVLTYALFPAYLTKNEAHILPTQNLAPATTYTVNFAGQMADGSIASKSWTFTTK